MQITTHPRFLKTECETCSLNSERSVLIFEEGVSIEMSFRFQSKFVYSFDLLFIHRLADPLWVG